ncbi:MAG: transketolase [Desulfarculus sp.]|nr:MAG: transketolase [Desulfarculus sp.]
MSDKELQDLSINTIRMLAADMVEKANSGHPGMPLGAAPMAYVLWSQFMRYNPADPAWVDRDRFVLSAGHGSALLYAMLHLTGYALSLEDLLAFRQWGSKTPGHPEYGRAPGVEATTGPLGQGFAMGVGMALAERFLAQQFNRGGLAVVDHYTYAIVSDGDLMEGVASEAASLAATLGLGKLIYLYDDNHISIEGGTELAFTEDRLARFAAYGWHTKAVADGNDTQAIAAAVEAARAENDRPSLIAVRTHIGYGSPKVDTAGVHGEPLGAEALAATRRNLGCTGEAFCLPDQARRHMLEAGQRGAERQRQWQEMFAAYAKAHPELAARFRAQMAGELPAGWDAQLPSFPAGEKIATRAASGKVLNAIAAKVPNLVGGSADLAPSTKTLIAGSPDMRPSQEPGGRNIHFGVREHGMAATVNGMALHGGVIPYGATFFVFADYMRPALRLSAVMGCHSIWVFTHDSIGVGEDGPTHQPVEHLMSLRAMPGFTVLRPAEGNETAAAWRVAMQHKQGPVALVLTRQKLPCLDPAVHPMAAGVAKGAYVLNDCQGTPQLLLIATGSEVTLALAAQAKLEQAGVAARVISMPSWELFAAQDQAYRDAVLPPGVKARLAIEAGASLGWERWVGDAGVVIGLDRFGESAPGPTVMDKLGFNLDNVAAQALELLGR